MQHPPFFTRKQTERLSLAQLNPQTQVAHHFKLYELTRSETAERRGVANQLTSDDCLRAAVHLANHVLDPIRQHHGRLSPNSVFRSQSLERVLKGRPAGWISTSPHTLGWACDVEVPGVPTLDLALWLSQALGNFDQIICECFNPAQGPNSGWVHVSLAPPWVGSPNRRELLSYVADPMTGRMVYVQGLQASPTV